MADALGISRTLTLVFTDLADSTALKLQHGDDTVAKLIARHRTLVSRLAANCGGRIIDWAGDGCFLTFEAPSAAVAFALHLQRSHHEDPDLPDVRTGLHVGEVGERPAPGGGDANPRVEGLAVDLAARISSLSRPGQVLTSSAVAHSARQRLGGEGFERPIRWQSHGRYSLKGFDEPLEIREVGIEGVAPFEAPPVTEKAAPIRPQGAAPITAWRATALAALAGALVLAAILWWIASRPASEPAVPPGNSIAVLPFVNMSSDAENEYFSDGISEEILDELVKQSSLKVIARASSFQFKGENRDIREIGEMLNVTHVLEGSVRKAGSRVRITAQLIETGSGTHLWSESYDRDLQDIFVVQDEIAQMIIGALRAHLVGTRDSPQQIDPEAYEHYLLGNFHANRQEIDEAIEQYGLAVALDPDFAAAYGALSRAHHLRLFYDLAPVSDELPLVQMNFERALSLDPEQPEAPPRGPRRALT